jgi:ubiquitin-protein ligase E3 A
LEEIRLVGLLLGLAIYNGVILDIHFPPVLYKKLMGKPVTLEDLMTLEPVLGRSLLTLLEFEGDVESAFSRSFQIDIQIFGETQTIDLVENGADKPLTNENRDQFVRLYVDFLLNKSVEKAFNAFKRGFDLICSESAISLFRPEELELLICGDSDLDFEALKNNTTYDGGYSLETPVIKFFWDAVLEFDDEKKKRLLFFATGTDRVPIGGLAKLTFVIAKNGTDSDRLPSSHTCFNVLLLPEYSSADKLKERLLTAIQNSEGFGMI